MNLRAASLTCLVLVLGVTGCNDLIGAGSPEVAGAPSADDGDGESGAEPGPLCGNGVVDPGEECDDGNDADSDGCYNCKHDCGPLPEFKWSLTGACYRLEADTKKSWRAAKTDCETWGGTLAVLTTVDEYAFVQEHIREDTWIGGHDPAGPTSFEWVTGEPWTVEKFTLAPAMDDLEACISIAGDTLAMRRDDCLLTAGYVCEKAPVAPK